MPKYRFEGLTCPQMRLDIPFERAMLAAHDAYPCGGELEFAPDDVARIEAGEEFEWARMICEKCLMFTVVSGLKHIKIVKVKV